MSCFRICMSIGVNQLLNAASYFILAYYMTEVRGKVWLWSSRSTKVIGSTDDILASVWYPNGNHISNEDKKMSHDQILDRPAKCWGKSAFLCHLWCCSSHDDGRNFEPPWYASTSMLAVRNFNMWVLWSCDGLIIIEVIDLVAIAPHATVGMPNSLVVTSDFFALVHTNSSDSSQTEIFSTYWEGV